MKVLIFCLLIAAVSCVEYRFPTNTSVPACKLVTIDLSLTLTQTDAEGKDVESITLDFDTSNVTVLGDKCSLDNATSSTFGLSVQDGEAIYNFLFTKDGNNMLSMTQTFTFIPDKWFTAGENDTLAAVLPSVPLTAYNKAYICDSEQQWSVMSEGESYNYTVEVRASNVQIQVFNVQNSTYTPGDHCAADVSTSMAPDTSPMTTATPAQVTTFELKEDNDTRIIMQFADTIHVEYEKKDQTKVTVPVPSVPQSAAVSGEWNETEASLVLTYDGDVMTFEFTDVNSMATLSSIIYSVTLDATRFPDAANQGQSETFNLTVSGVTSADTTFYKCNSPTTLTFENSKTNVVLSQVKFQAFNVNETFTGTGDECAADTPTTTTPVTPPVTTSKPPVDPPVNNYTYSNCILVRTGLKFNIPYNKTGDKAANAEILVPKQEDVKVTGDCNLTSTSQMIQLEFFDSWMIQMIFGQTSDSVEATADAKKAYALQNITFMYKEDVTRFPDTKNAGAPRTVRASNLEEFKVSADQNSFKCKSEVDIHLDNGVDLSTMNFQYRAFANDTSTVFKDDGVNECAADSDSNSVVPIAVGAALAGLVVIVLIAYLIGRRRSKRTGYESV